MSSSYGSHRPSAPNPFYRGPSSGSVVLSCHEIGGLLFFKFVLSHCSDWPQYLSTMQGWMMAPAFTSVYSSLTSFLELLESSLLALALLWHTLSTLGVWVFPSMYHSMSNGLCYWALLSVRAELDDYMIYNSLSVG